MHRDDMECLMKKQKIFFAVILALAPGISTAQAQQAPRVASETIILSPATTNAAIRHEAIYRIGNQTYLTADYLLGALTAIRLRFPSVNFTDQVRLNFEGYFGGGVTSVGIGPLAGGGLRVRINVTDDRAGRNAFFISPGTDVLAIWDDTADTGWFDFGPDSTVYFLTTDTDLTWVHQFATHFGIELGARFGAAVSLGGLDSAGRQSRGRVTPILSLLTGLRF